MILVTGGNGYIGSHFILELLYKGYEVISIDNLVNSSKENIKLIKEISKKNFIFIEGDLRNKDLLNEIFSKYAIDCVVHFAGLKYISESYLNPIEYFAVNVNGSVNLFEAMSKASVYEIIFSSSATVYGSKHKLPWNESISLKLPSNPYAQTKFIVENILKNIHFNDRKWKIGILRYFNPVGYHSSGKIGEKINEGMSNLIPSIIKVISSREKFLKIYGDDYETLDGSGVRDYIHINDLIDGHLKAMQFIKNNGNFNIWNLGRGEGYSVLQVIERFEYHLGKKIPYKIYSRRPGDLPAYWADANKAKAELLWSPHNDLDQMIKDTLAYLKNQ